MIKKIVISLGVLIGIMGSLRASQVAARAINSVARSAKINFDRVATQCRLQLDGVCSMPQRRQLSTYAQRMPIQDMRQRIEVSENRIDDPTLILQAQLGFKIEEFLQIKAYLREEQMKREKNFARIPDIDEPQFDPDPAQPSFNQTSAPKEF